VGLDNILGLTRRLGRKPPPDLWQLGLDAREVMSARISRAMFGRLSAAEARRMVLEKQSAAIRAQHVYARALLDADLASATRGVLDIYHRVVRANRKRLRNRRGR